MRLSEFINKFYLHDSIVEEILYIIKEKILQIKIELCNWKQEGYEESAPEMIKGSLEFTGVNRYSLEPNSLSSDGAEILEVKILSTSNNVEVMQIVLLDNEEIKMITIEANELAWKE